MTAPQKNRRAFLRGLMQALIAAVLVMLGFRITGNRQAKHTCTHKGVCGKCPAASRCILPSAVSLRQANRRFGEGGPY